jgi:hypothetical protein
VTANDSQVPTSIAAARIRAPWTLRGYRRELEAWNGRFKRDEIRPKADTLKFVIPILEQQTSRAVDQIERTETKAALVVPAIGVIVGIVAPLIPGTAMQNPGITPWILGGAMLMVLLSLLSALTALWPRLRSNGPTTDQVLVGSAEPVEEAHWNYLKSLGFAAASTEAVALDKADWLISTFLFGTISIVLFVVFTALGGLKP